MWFTAAGTEGSMQTNPLTGETRPIPMNWSGNPTSQVQQQQVPFGYGGGMFNSGYNPTMGDPMAGVNGGGQPNVFNSAAGAYSTGIDTLSRVANPYAVNMTMNQFVNPYRQMVIDRALATSREQRNIDLNQVRGQAAQSAAYGGARQGLVEATLMDDYSQNENDMIARLLQQGFDTTSTLALNTLGQQANAAGNLISGAGTGVNIGSAAVSGQQQAGTVQQSLIQQILSQASGQTDTMINYPQQALSTALAGVQGNPLAGNQTQTASYKPGLFDYLSFGAGLAGGGK